MPPSMTAQPPVTDRLQRPLHDLRVSVTDRCNLRCTYCMPREVFGPDFVFLPPSELLSFEEITRVTRAFTGLGVSKVRLTGGEPLVRRELARLVDMLAALDGVEDIALTTNGVLLPRQAEQLRDAGLTRVTISLDALDDVVFRRMADVQLPVSRVLEGIDAAVAAGLTPVKINAVVQRSVNDDQVLALAEWGREQGHTVRFIEFMDVGTTNGWELSEVVPADEVVERISARWPLDPVPPATPGEVADRYRYRDGAGEVGVVASVTRPFCGTCTRARLSSIGEVFTCLFAARGHDLRGPLRAGADDAEMAERVRAIWEGRTDRYSELRTAETSADGGERVEMSYIGG